MNSAPPTAGRHPTDGFRREDVQAQATLADARGEVGASDARSVELGVRYSEIGLGMILALAFWGPWSFGAVLMSLGSLNLRRVGRRRQGGDIIGARRGSPEPLSLVQKSTRSQVSSPLFREIGSIGDKESVKEAKT
ncbi:hypothetical protein K438DRAFT_1770174 [Mycena galopus ATCC 62051]|nr:hypothetical protein K438DRAFT_1770174 [Mycena galopus ATCC 62051]